MNRKLLLLAIMTLLPTGLVLGFSTGPPAGYAGDPPGNNNCTACHTSFPLNSGDGELSLTELAEYEPGQTYTMTVNLSDPGQSRWGFQLIPKDENNVVSGDVIITDQTRTQFAGDYLEHTSAGTNPGTDGNSWSFDWTAPEVGAGPVTFYVAGNAANNNGTNQGDYIYTIQVTIPEATTGVDDDVFASAPSAWKLVQAYPNPFNGQLTVNLLAGSNAITTVAVYDLLGRRVATLYSGQLTQGMHTLSWQPQSSAGTYFLRAENSRGWSATQRVQYLK